MEKPYNGGEPERERRKHERFDVEALDVIFTVRGVLSGEQFKARLLDISLGGCRIALLAAEAHGLQNNGACVCVLPVGVADFPCEYAAAVVGRRGEENEPLHSIHLRFNGASPLQQTLLERWIDRLNDAMRTTTASEAPLEERVARVLNFQVPARPATPTPTLA